MVNSQQSIVNVASCLIPALEQPGGFKVEPWFQQDEETCPTPNMSLQTITEKKIFLDVKIFNRHPEA